MKKQKNTFLCKNHRPKSFSSSSKLSFDGVDIYITKKSSEGKYVKIFCAYTIPEFILITTAETKELLVAKLIANINLLKKKIKERR